MKVREKAKQSSKAADEALVEEYKPTPFEAEALEHHRIASHKSAPRLKFISDGRNPVKIEVEHPDASIGILALMKAMGTADYDFYEGFIGQLVNASKDHAPSEIGLNFMLSVIKGIQPRDQIETMLAAQMAAVHMASMTFARRLAHVDNIHTPSTPRPESAWGR
jgi:hypothetical protein